MKKILKKTAWILMWVILSIPPIVYGLLWYFSSDLKAYALKEINAKLSATLEVDKIDVELIKHFPNVSLAFHQLKIHNKAGMVAGNLLEADQVYLRFNIWDVMTKNFHISNILIQQGKLNGIIDKYGNTNYSIVKPDTSASDNNFWLRLNFIELKQIEVTHQQTDFICRAEITELTARGDIHSDQINFEERSDIKHLSIVKNNIYLFKDRPLLSQLNCKLNLKSKTFIVEKSNLISDDLNTDVQGIYQYNSASSIDFKVHGREMGIPSLASLFGLKAKTDAFKSDGDIYFKASVKGLLYNNHTPEIKADFGIKNGVLSKSGYQMKHINLTGNYHILPNQDIEQGVLNISSIQAEINQSRINGHLKIVGLNHPQLDALIDAQVNAKDLEFISNHEQHYSGTVDAHLNIQYMSQSDEHRLEELNASGKVKMNHLSISNANNTLEDIHGILQFNKNKIEINNLTGKANLNDFEINGKFNNWYGYLFKKETLKLQAEIESRHFEYFTSKDSSSVDFNLFPRVESDIQFHCSEFQFNKILFNQVSSHVVSNDKRILFSNTSAQAFHGKIQFDIIEFKEYQQGYLLETKGAMKQVFITEIFRDFNNFNQDIIIDKQIGGVATVNDLYTVIQLSKKLEVATNLMKMSGHFIIAQGELLNFEPILKLGKFIEVEELRNLKFNTLENDILIENGIIHIPQMNIKSNAIQLNIKGEHDFNNKMDYYIKVNLNELLFKKRKQQTVTVDGSGFEVEEDDGKKGINLYIHMTGVPPDVKFKYDKRGFKKEAQQNIKEEKKKLKDAFKKDFKGVNDEQLNPKKEPPKKEEKKDEEVQWDE